MAGAKSGAPSLLDYAASRGDGRVERGLYGELPPDVLEQILPARDSGISVKAVSEWLTLLGYNATRARVEALLARLGRERA